LMRGSDDRVRPIWRFLIAALGAFVILRYLAPIAAYIIHPQNDDWFEVIHRPLVAAMLLGFYVLLLRGLDDVEKPIDSLGLPLDQNWWKHLGIGVALGAALVAVIVGAIAIVGQYAIAREGSGTWWLLLMIHAWILLTGALAEELAFRGYPFQRLV